MRCLPYFLLKKTGLGRQLTRVAFAFVCAFVLAACGPSPEALQAQIDALQSQVEKQGAQLEALNAFHASHGGLLKQLSTWESIRFRVDRISFDVVEEAFEPLIVGKADLSVVGDSQPELIFVEWAVTVTYKDQPLEPATYIQRVENGSATLKIIHPLPSHGIGKEDVRLQVKPTGWYLAHVARITD